MTGSYWEGASSALPTLPSLERDISAEVVVVGLGGSGLTAIGELLARGLKVVGLDAASVASGAAGRNGGLLLAGLADFYHVAVAKLGAQRALACYLATLDELDRIYEMTPGATSRVGSLRIAGSEDEETDCERQYSAMLASGLPVERYTGPEGTGLYFGSDGTVQPVERCRILAERALRGGAQLFARSPVISARSGRVLTATARVDCDSVLVCVDGALERLVPVLAGCVRSARLQMLATAPLAERVAPVPVYRRYGLDYWQQLASGEIVLGGCRDLGGDDEWTTLAEPSETVQRGLDRLLESALGVQAPVTHRWAGVVAYTHSRLPVVREVEPRLFVAGGYSGTGNVVGALAARGLVELAVDARSELASLFDCGEP